MSIEEETMVAEKLARLRSKTADKYARAGHRVEGTSEKIMAVLKAASIKKLDIGFSDPLAMKGTFEAVANAVRREAPINLILPLGGGKVANPLKTGSGRPGELPPRGSHRSGLAELPHPALRITDSLNVVRNVRRWPKAAENEVEGDETPSNPLSANSFDPTIAATDY